MNGKRSTQGSAHAAVIVCLVIIVIFVIGWIFWQNFIQKDTISPRAEPTVENTDSTLMLSNSASTEENVSKKEDASSAPTSGTGFKDTDYLEIPTWNVRMKLPIEIRNTKVHYKNLSLDSIGFATERMKKVGCDISKGDWGPDALWRSKVSQEGAPDMIPLNDNNPIGGYFYYAIGARSSCATTASGVKIENSDREKLQVMIKAVEAIR